MSTTALLTFADFEQLPDAPGKRELIDGELIELPPPKYKHSKVALRLYYLFRSSSLEERACHETGFRIGGGWLQPDVSVTWPDQRLENDYLCGAPMIAVEVLSPSNTAPQIERKLTLYLSDGGREVWVIDPSRRTMTVYRSAEGQVYRISVEKSYVSELAGVTIELNRLFD